MVQIVEPGRNRLGEQLNEILMGLGQAKYAEHKQKQERERSQKQRESGLASLFSHEQAKALSNLDPELLKPIIAEHAKQEFARPGNEAAQRTLSELFNQGQQVEQPNLENESGINSTNQKPINFSGVNAKDTKSIINTALKQREIKAKEKAVSEKAKQEAFKQTKSLREGLFKEGRTSKNALKDLNRVQDLEKEGKLDTPGFTEFLKRSGLDIPALLNPGSEEFNKIVGNFQRGAKDIYGARITNFELENFLKLLPSLSQSPEGRKRVISNLKRLYRGNVAYLESAKKIIRDNKGIPPLDLMEQIDEQVEPLLDKISEEFKKDLAVEVPAGQNKLVTAVQSGLGSLIGIPGQVLGGIGSLLKKVTS